MNNDTLYIIKVATLLISGCVIGWNTSDQPWYVTIPLAVVCAIAISFTFDLLKR